jgi:hypothetical protein
MRKRKKILKQAMRAPIVTELGGLPDRPAPYAQAPTNLLERAKVKTTRHQWGYQLSNESYR